MAEPQFPLATIELRHARIELWPYNVTTVFPDGKQVVAAPNGDETIIETACHEALHSILQLALSDRPSHCLRAVADEDGKRWTPERREEEALAYGMTPHVAALVRAVGKAYAQAED